MTEQTAVPDAVTGELLTDTGPIPGGSPLATKLARVMAAVHRVPKNGRNEFHKYSYATEADIVEAVRGALAEQGVALVPSIVSLDMKPIVTGDAGREKTKTITLLNVTFTLIDGQSGERFVANWFGTGEDSGDKGPYKAMTGAEKYFLLKLFLIPTGDDPEVAGEGKANGNGKGKTLPAPPRKAPQTAVTSPPETKVPAEVPTATVAATPAPAPVVPPVTITRAGKVDHAGAALYVILTSDGQRLVTRDLGVARLAQQFKKDGTPVLLTAETTDLGATIVELSSALQAA